jgi:type I restriction enzyme S subunit
MSGLRLKHVVEMRAGGTPPVDDPTMWDEDGLPWVAIGDITRSAVVTSTDRRVSAAGVAAKSLPIGTQGTVLFAMYASVGALGLLATQGSWNQAILGMTPVQGRADSRFLTYWLTHLTPSLGSLFRSNTQDNLNAEQVGNLPFADTPLDEQSSIADFLDVETARIDALCVLLDEVSQRVQERRLGQVHDLVTGASNRAKSETKLPWAAVLPAGWPVVKLNYVARQGSGHTPSRSQPEWWRDCHIPWITTGEVQQVRDDRREVITDTRESISELGLANSSAEVHSAGTVVLCRTAASAGYSAVMGVDMATSQDFATWTCGPRLDPFYLLWCLRAMRPDLLGRLAMGSTHKTIYMPDIQTIRIPLPTMHEQRQIVAEIQTRNHRLDALLDRIERQQLLLAERRQAVITFAVTGQLDVTTARGVA